MSVHPKCRRLSHSHQCAEMLSPTQVKVLIVIAFSKPSIRQHLKSFIEMSDVVLGENYG